MRIITIKISKTNYSNDKSVGNMFNLKNIYNFPSLPFGLKVKCGLDKFMGN